MLTERRPGARGDGGRCPLAVRRFQFDGALAAIAQGKHDIDLKIVDRLP